MTVKTKTVEGRRELHFDSLEDLSADVDRLEKCNVKLLGNWTLAQILKHLAMGLNATLDGSSFKAPFFMKVIAPLMKKKFLYGGIPPGFVIPKAAEAQFLPRNDVRTDAAAADLRAAIVRVTSADEFAPHPLLGNLSKQEVIQFQLRHAEMHLSFAIPVE